VLDQNNNLPSSVSEENALFAAALPLQTASHDNKGQENNTSVSLPCQRLLNSKLLPAEDYQSTQTKKQE
jgi:hypothetical protein